MLLRHSLTYVLARGVPGIINLLAIAVYTRLMSPGEYGQYALVIAAVGLIDSVLFQWIRLGLLRFLPRHGDQPQVLLTTLFTAFLLMVAFTGVIGVISYFIWPDLVESKLLVTGIVLLWVQGWYELNLELARSQLAPLRYGLMSIFKSLLALVMGWLLVLQGMGAQAPLLGFLTGMVLVSLVLACREWRVLNSGVTDRELFGKLLRYGLPMTATYSLSFLISSSDRFLLGWFMGAEAPGLYSPGYDLTQFSLLTLMTIVNLAAYPVIVRLLEQTGVEAAQEQLKNMVVLLVAISLPAATGLAICSENISNIMLGEMYRESASVLIPFIALSSFIFGIKIFYLDLAFQLGNKTYIEPWVMLAAASVNVLLNLWWIPLFGLTGAACATVAAYSVGAFFSWKLGKQVFRLPDLSPDVWKIVLATGVMALVLLITADYQGATALLGQIASGVAVYVSMLVFFDVAGLRKKVLINFLRR